MPSTPLVAFVVSLWFTLACTTPGAAQTIRGQVVDSATGLAVPRGFVVLVGQDGTDLARALSDAEGGFGFSVPMGRTDFGPSGSDTEYGSPRRSPRAA